MGNTIKQGDGACVRATLSAVTFGSGRVPAPVAMGEMHTCVLLTTNAVKCDGKSFAGQLGDGLTYFSYGDNSARMGDNLPIVDLRIP